jgi:pimeloyl-ACP methyl ester carboxylesterase
MQTFDVRSMLEKIQTKMLLVAGEQDLSTPLYCATIINEKVQNSILKTFPNVGHMAHVEKKEEVLDMIEAFLL